MSTKQNMVQLLKEKQKAQKAAFKAKQIEYAAKKAEEFKPTLLDVFAVLTNHHKCISNVNRVDGVFAFLNICEITRLSATCKTLRTDVQYSRVSMHPVHLAARTQIVNKIAAQARSKRSQEIYEEKQKYILKVQRQLMHAWRYLRPKYQEELTRISREWKAKYKSTITFCLDSALSGSFYERF
jgi:hypothetical protein